MLQGKHRRRGCPVQRAFPGYYRRKSHPGGQPLFCVTFDCKQRLQPRLYLLILKVPMFVPSVSEAAAGRQERSQSNCKTIIKAKTPPGSGNQVTPLSQSYPMACLTFQSTYCHSQAGCSSREVAMLCCRFPEHLRCLPGGCEHMKLPYTVLACWSVKVILSTLTGSSSLGSQVEFLHITCYLILLGGDVGAWDGDILHTRQMLCL